jgi:hypothetical protein
MKWDVYEHAQPLLDESLKFVGAKRWAKHATNRGEMLDHILHEVVSAFVPETPTEKKIYADAAALIDYGLDDELKPLVSMNVALFLKREKEEQAKSAPCYAISPKGDI